MFREYQADFVDRVRQTVLSNDPHAFAGAYRVFATADAELASSIGTIECPTLVMTGEFDLRSIPAMAKEVARRVRGGECVIFAGQRNLTPLEVPAEIDAQVEGFLERRVLI